MADPTQVAGQPADLSSRTQPNVGTTNASTALTGPANTFRPGEDVGRAISGTGIPAGATIAAVASGTAATLSTNASATGTITATISGDAGNRGFVGWSPETAAQKATHTIAGGGGATAPTRMTNATTRQKQFFR